jgi:peroxiredoxin
MSAINYHKIANTSQIKRVLPFLSVFRLVNELQVLAPLGQMLSPFSLLDQHGKQVSLDSLFESGAESVLLVFFASATLVGDIEILNACKHYLERNPGRILVAISGINWEDQYQLSRKLGLSFPLLFDSCCRQAKKLGTLWIPKFVNGRALFEIDREKKVVFSTMNPLNFLNESMAIPKIY